MDEDLEKAVEKKYSQRDKKKKPRMHQSGKSVFQLKKLIENAPKTPKNLKDKK